MIQTVLTFDYTEHQNGVVVGDWHLDIANIVTVCTVLSLYIYEILYILTYLLFTLPSPNIVFG